MADEIERLSVTLETNADKLVKDATKVVKELEDQLQGMGDKGEEAFDKTGKAAEEAAGHYRDAAGRLRDASGKFVKLGQDGKQAFGDSGRAAQKFGGVLDGLKGAAIFGAIAGAAQAATQAILGMATQGVRALVGLTQKAIGMQAGLESAQTVFTNMFGDKDAALAFLENLKQTAGQLQVPFSEAQRFAKSILPDTSSVEEFNELLRLAAIGARDANLPLEELIFSFNEAVSGDFTSIRDRLDIPRDVIANIKEADNVTEGLTTELNKLFTKRGINDLETFNDTLNGTTANLKTLADNLLSIAGQPGFEVLRDAATRLQEVLNENRPELEKIALALGEVSRAAIDFISTGVIDAIENLDTEATLELVDNLSKTVDSVGLLAELISDVEFNGLIEGASTVVELFNQALHTAAQIQLLNEAEAARARARREEVSKQVAEDAGGEGFLSGLAGAPVVGDALAGLTDLAGTQENADRLRIAGEEAYQQAILAGLPAFEEYNKKQEERKERVEAATKATGADADALDKVNEKLAENSDQLEVLNEKEQELLQKLGTDLLDLQEKTNAELESLQQEHGETMVSIAEEFAEKRADAAEDLADKLKDLEEETNQQRADIFRDARDDLTELERDTDKKLEEERDSFQVEERRRTEDHLRDMRQLRERYLFDLESAVASRDARAIVDLRRRFEREQAEQSQSAQIEQGRREEDKNRRLQELQAEEQERANEILRNRERELADLAIQEERKRQKLQESFNEQIVQLNEAETKKIEEEQAKFAEKQTLLEEALARELETIAKSLASQADVTEEGAAVILEKLANVFGEGGKVDSLMETFRKRVADLGKIKVDVDFESSGSSGGSSGPRQQAQSGGGGSGRVFQHGTKPGGELFTRPTAALFAEHSPEWVNITPLSQMSQMDSMGGSKEVDLNVRLSGSAPPGINNGADRDALAGVMIEALRSAGFRAKQG